MKRVLLIMIFIGIIIHIITAQAEGYEPRVVKEYPVSSDVNATFSAPVYNTYEDFGVHLACDLSGRIYLLDYDRQIIHVVNDSDFSIVKSFKVKPFPYDTLFCGDKDGFYYVSMSGFFQYIRNDGTVVFWGDLRDVMSFTPEIDIISSLYYADILFFMDNRNQIHSILSPSMDSAQNKKNYRNPEKTKALFQQDSGIDLKGLRIDERDRFILNGNFLGPKFMPNINQSRYTLNNDGNHIFNITIRDQQNNVIVINISNLSEEETPEGYAVHPSGDIYILRYNRTKKAHILFRIENTWDSVARQAFSVKK